ncbi:MAG: metallophosphoesterase family protein [Polyangiaceae bacterium]
MRFLCLSDIHGYADALDVVLDEAKNWGYDKLVVCGDLLFPGPEPLRVWKRLVEAQALCVQGLTDKAISELDPDELKATTEDERLRLERLERLHGELGDLILERLRRLPTQARLPLESGHEMLVTHGSPADPTIGMTHDLTDEELYALMGDDPADLVICGGDHVPFQRILEDCRIVGVGSVGEAPTRSVAYATIVTSTPTQTSIEQKEVELSFR